jgi:hypothetical protein
MRFEGHSTLVVLEIPQKDSVRDRPLVGDVDEAFQN